MSQVVSERQEALPSPVATRDPNDEFAYRPVPALAPISLFLAFCSLAGFLAIPCLAIGGVGMVTGLIALWQIRRSAGEFGGGLVATLGASLSLLLVVGASGFHTYAYITELPEGYERVSFIEMAKHPPIYDEKGNWTIDPEVAALDGKPIYIKGFMFPTSQKFNLTEFLLVKDTGQCCFGGQPKPSDMIAVTFDNGMMVNHREQILVGVAGIFRAKNPTSTAGLKPVYVLEGTHFR
jgi:hypothetical protein